MKNILAVIVLTWNDYKNTVNCLNSILNQKYKNYKIFLIDNNSKDGSFEKILNYLKKKSPNLLYKKKINKNFCIKKNTNKFKIFYLRNAQNLGCGYGHNPGYQVSIKNKFVYISRIDNDMIMKNNFFLKILQNFEDQQIQAISPKILYKDDRKIIWWKGTYIGSSLKLQKHLRNYPYKTKDSKETIGLINTDAIAGCASIIRSSRVKKVGYNDKDFFYGPEDVEYSKRLFNGKGSLKVDLSSKIFHGISKSFYKLNKRKKYFEYKYRLLLIKKIGNIWDKIFGYSIFFIKFFFFIILFLNNKNKDKIIPVFFAGLHFFQNKLGEHDRKNTIKF
jgi:GT2 family glycosyltransferase